MRCALRACSITGSSLGALTSPGGPLSSLPLPISPLQVREGLLEPAYRTQLCSRYLSGLPCRQPAACPHAHSLQELRVDAAIEVRCRQVQGGARRFTLTMAAEREEGVVGRVSRRRPRSAWSADCQLCYRA